MPPKYRVGDRVRINEKLFPSYEAGLFMGLPKRGTVRRVDPESILPYQVEIDTFVHHPFWFAEDQLFFEDEKHEAEWQAANKPKPRAPAPKAGGAA